VRVLGFSGVWNKLSWGQRTLRSSVRFPMMFWPMLVGFQF